MTKVEEARDHSAILQRVSEALTALANVSQGNYAARLAPDAGDGVEVSQLYSGINEMLEALATEQASSVAYQRDLEDKLATIEQQRAAIRELSTPIMEIWDGVLCLPVVGVMDTIRSDEITNSLLRSVIEKKARYVIVDITGIEVMDTRTVDHFLRMAKSVKLLGAECAMTGIGPHIAQTVVHMGVDLGSITTYRSLREALTIFVDQQSA